MDVHVKKRRSLLPKNGLIFIVKRSLDWSKTCFVLHVAALSASVFPCCECKIRDLFASIWGAFWCHFGVMGPSGAPVVSFPSKVGKITSTWGAFGRPLGPFGRLLGSIWAALGCHCDPSVAKMAPTSVQHLEKVDQNMHFDTASVFASIFYRNLFPGRAHGTPKIMKI